MIALRVRMKGAATSAIERSSRASCRQRHGHAAPTAAGQHNNLPVSLTSFIGRERELDEVCSALASTRLLTLTGAGRCGKTRRALRAATEVPDRFPSGAWWVELAAVADEALVGATIAKTLGVRPLPGMTELQGTGTGRISY
jgi:hypothetical protein